jgi:NitT/TauT family transport system permease protein
VHEHFLFNIGQTLLRVVLGMLATLTVSVIVGVAMGLDRRLEKFFDLFVLLGRAIPGLAWALLSVMIVGINNGAPILAITMASTPMVTLQMWEGTKALDRDLLQMAHVFGLSRQQRIRHIVLPSILPYMVAGTKLGLALSWQVVVLSELFGLSNGVGFKINQAFAAFSIPAVMAWTLSFTAVMAIIEFGMLGPVERRLTRWRRAGAVV